MDGIPKERLDDCAGEIQKIADKGVPFHEFEEVIVELLKASRMPPYFERVLSRLGIREPAALLSQIAVPGTPEEPQWSLRPDVVASAFTSDQVRSVLEVARQTFTEERWKARKR